MAAAMIIMMRSAPAPTAMAMPNGIKLQNKSWFLEFILRGFKNSKSVETFLLGLNRIDIFVKVKTYIK